MEPWTPADSIVALIVIQFGLTWDWAQDYIREMNKLNGLGDLVDLFSPYTMNYLSDGMDTVTVLDEIDLKQMG